MPNVGRIYDAFLGGKDNFACDRQVAQEMRDAIPDVEQIAREMRAFLGRATRFLVEQGIRQFIDVGTGLPTKGHVHEVTAAHAPDSRVVYVDNDPVVLAHARALIPDRGHTTIIEGDVYDPAGILRHPDTRRLIDFDQPVAVMLVAILHFVAEFDRARAIAREFMGATAPGSYLTLSHDTRDGPPPAAVERAEKIYNQASAPLVFRTREEIAALFDGLELVEPGLEYVNQWRPTDYSPPDRRWVLGGVGRKPDDQEGT